MKSILLYNSGGGLGDAIQLFELILSLQKHFKTLYSRNPYQIFFKKNFHNIFQLGT
jgi:hypothetical protein